MLDVPDAYPPDDAELDALHPDTPADEQTADWVRQRDYEDFVRVLNNWPTDRVLRELAWAILGYGDDTPHVTAYAAKYGWRAAIHVVYGVLPSQRAG